MTAFEDRTCTHCTFYKPGAHYDCRENVEELVKDKDRPNFCEWFKEDPALTAADKARKKEKASSAEKAFDSFFNI